MDERTLIWLALSSNTVRFGPYGIGGLREVQPLENRSSL